MTYQPQPAKKLTRTPEDKVIAGVCGGLAKYLNMDATLVRVLLVVVTLFLTGLPLVIYIVLWLVLPEGEGGTTGMDTVSTAFGNTQQPQAPQYPNTTAPQYGQQPPAPPQYGQQPPAPPQYGQQPPAPPQYGQQPPVAPEPGAPMAPESPGYPLYEDHGQATAEPDKDWASTPYSPPVTPPEAPVADEAEHDSEQAEHAEGSEEEKGSTL